MANLRVINGKNTQERLHEEFQKLLDSGERISVVEFSRRVSIAYDTLTHRYRDWAEKSEHCGMKEDRSQGGSLL